MSTRENRFRPPGLNEVEETMWPPVGFMKETLSIFDKRFLITPTDKKKCPDAESNFLLLF